MVHHYVFHFPLPNSVHITKPTKLDYKQLSFIARKEMFELNTKIIRNKLNQSIKYVPQFSTQEIDELTQRSENILFNLYLYENQAYFPDFVQQLNKTFSDLELTFDISEHFRFSLTIIKKRYLNEPITNVSHYLQYLNINNKKSHRDYIMADIKHVFLSDLAHIEEIDTSKLFDYKNSKKVKHEIEEHLKAALINVQQPQDAVVIL